MVIESKKLNLLKRSPKFLFCLSSTVLLYRIKYTILFTFDYIKAFVKIYGFFYKQRFRGYTNKIEESKTKHDDSIEISFFLFVLTVHSKQVKKNQS